MASNYPGALDNFATNHVSGQVVDPTTDNDQADAINKIEAELGTDPSGTSFTTVKQRLDAILLATVFFAKAFQNHGADPNVARPQGFASVEWYGSVPPNNALNGDTWINTA